MKHTGRIIRCFLDTDMRLSHDGLAVVAKKGGINVSRLESGQFIVFINSAKDRVKIYAEKNVFAYARMDQGRKIDLRVIQEIPRVFQMTGRLDLDEALKATLEKALPAKIRAVA